MFTKWFKYIKQHWVLSLLIIISFLVYLKLLFYGHISWDDPEMVFKNKAVKNFDLKTLFTNHYVGNYIPITMLGHSLAWLLFENWAGGHHLINILLHLVNGILVYRLAEYLFKSNLVSLIGAAIFLLHPLQIESVAWIGELKNVLSSTFYLASTLAYMQFSEEHKKSYQLKYILFFLLGCLSKSSVVVLPFVFIAIDFFKSASFSWKIIITKIPLLLLSILFGIINLKTQSADLFINHAHEFPLWQRNALAGFALLNYLILFLLPVNLSVIYPYPPINTATFVIGFAFFIGLFIISFLCWKRKKYMLLFLIFFMLINLVLVLQFIPFGEVLYADRYAYIPIIAFAWFIGTLILKLQVKPVFILPLLLLPLALLSYQRITLWKNAITLYESILKIYPQQYVALNSAGVECMRLNEDKKALNYLNEAIKVAPNNYKSFYNKGLLLIKNNKPKQAIESFNKALQLYQYPKAFAARASAYYMLGHIAKGMNVTTQIISEDKKNATAHFVLGNCYNDINKLDVALIEYNTCIELNTEDADYYFKRAIVFGKKQEFKESLSDLTICISINPLYREAYYWRGVAKLNLKLNPCDVFQVADRSNFEPAVKAYYKYCH